MLPRSPKVQTDRSSVRRLSGVVIEPLESREFLSAVHKVHHTHHHHAVPRPMPTPALIAIGATPARSTAGLNTTTGSTGQTAIGSTTGTTISGSFQNGLSPKGIGTPSFSVGLLQMGFNPIFNRPTTFVTPQSGAAATVPTVPTAGGIGSGVFIASLFGSTPTPTSIIPM